MVNYINYIALGLFTLGIIGLFTVRTFVDNKSIKEYSDDILNIFPIFILFFIPINLNVLIWVIGITLAYNIIEKHRIIGMFLYLATYIFVGLTLMFSNFYYKELLISVSIVLIIIGIATFIIGEICKKDDLLNININTKVLNIAIVYALISFTFLIYTFIITHNFGFIILILSDIFLGIKYIIYYSNKMTINTNKVLSYFVLLLFYVGAIFASISISFI